MKKFTFILWTAFFLFGKIYSQNCSTMNMQWQADIPSTCNEMVMTMIHDQLNRPFLYIANKEAGFKIYDVSIPSSPVLVATLPTSLYGGLEVMNLYQDSNYVYLALGNTFTNPQMGGMAIVDVTAPATANVTDHYIVPASASGGGIVKVEGNYAYLGAMKSGVVILDVTNKNSIQFVSQFVPSISFPPIANPNPNYYNARGMAVKNSIVYLCYDGGGIRIINCTNKLSPVETGRWCNPVMYTPLDHAKAYNNIILDDTLAYIAVDYCGMEVLNISDTSNMTLVGWWNPYNCPNNNWFTSPVHANEIQYNKNCKQIFLSTGKSDMMVIDVSNPAMPDSCNFYGGTLNDIGTWGAGIYQNQIYLSYICVPFPGVPFPSNWTGVKILTYDTCKAASGIYEQERSTSFSVYPNPASMYIEVRYELSELRNAKLEMYNSVGQLLLSTLEHKIDVRNFTKGMYYLKVANAVKKIIIE